MQNAKIRFLVAQGGKLSSANVSIYYFLLGLIPAYYVRGQALKLSAANWPWPTWKVGKFEERREDNNIRIPDFSTPPSAPLEMTTKWIPASAGMTALIDFSTSRCYASPSASLRAKGFLRSKWRQGISNIEQGISND